MPDRARSSERWRARGERFRVSPAVVRPLRPRDTGREPDVVEAPRLYPRVAPGDYVCVTRAVAMLGMYGRRIVRVLVDLHETEAVDGSPLAEGVPMFLPVPGRAAWRAAPTSALVRLYLLAGISIPRRGPLPLADLVGKVLRVQVGDVLESREREPDPANPARKVAVPLPEPLRYSVVRRALERLA